MTRLRMTRLRTETPAHGKPHEMKKTLLTTALMCIPLSATSLQAKEVALINGHLLMELPDNATLGDSDRDLASARPGNAETVYWIGEGGERVAVYAIELFQFAEPDFTAQAENGLREAAPAGFEVCTMGENIVYAIATRAVEKPTGADLYASAFVRSEDGTVQRIQFVFDAGIAKDITRCRQLVLDALGSIRQGVSPELGARQALLGTAPDGSQWRLPVPDGYYGTRESTADSTTFRFREVRRGESKGSAIGVYFGPSPKLKCPAGCAKRPGTLLGRPVEWSVQAPRSENGYHRAETVLPLPVADGAAPMHIHIFIHADTTEKLDALIPYAEGLGTSPAPEAP